MERPSYRGELSHVRKEVAELHEHDPELARERAKLFRMELQLENAQAAKIVTQSVEQNPDSHDLMALFSKIKQEGLHLYPQAIEHFYHQLVLAQEQSEGVVADIRESLPEGGSVAEAVFNALRHTKEDRPLEGQLKLDESYPLGLILYVENSDDFAQIDTRRNVGGFYQPETNFYYKQGLGDNPDDPEDYETCLTQFPCIVIKGREPMESEDDPLFQSVTRVLKEVTAENQARTLAHEKAHAENAALYKTPRGQRRFVWGDLLSPQRIEDVSYSLINEYYFNQYYGDPSIEGVKNSRQWKQLLHTGLALAKDEILAEMAATNGHIENHVRMLKEKKDVYDYFADFLLDDSEADPHPVELERDIDNEFFQSPLPGEATKAVAPKMQMHQRLKSDLYESLWQEYEHILDQAIATINPIIQTYQQYGFTERIELFRWVLAQLNIAQWPKQLEGTLYKREADELNLVIQDLFEPPDSYGEVLIYKSDLPDSYREAFHDLQSRCMDNPAQPYFDFIQEYHHQKLEQG